MPVPVVQVSAMRKLPRKHGKAAVRIWRQRYALRFLNVTDADHRQNQLLDHETRAAEQVPLLLGMREDGRALEKAVDSGDTDLGKHKATLLVFY